MTTIDLLTVDQVKDELEAKGFKIARHRIAKAIRSGAWHRVNRTVMVDASRIEEILRTVTQCKPETPPCPSKSGHERSKRRARLSTTLQALI